ncbi:substrate-binding domain-containing protein [Microbacterium aoyamense]|uniref:Substrate-binding domain-containing protein n=1 Tax=Microbacterium aoyamense TaxID=344166 RepID=A0ABN2PXA3_9MICO|nr:LacI family DNA-binding transcriptional regulator [Microbacterium aoyamense]
MSSPSLRNGHESVGIEDVARLAGVSVSTVSNALNHPHRLAVGTMERVRRAIEVLDYVPSSAARSLAAGSSASIGLVLSDLGNSLFVDIARGAEDAADAADLSVLLANTDARLERESRAIELFESARVEGLLVTLNDSNHFRSIAARRQRRAPIVLLNYHDGSGLYCSAYIDNVHGGRVAAEHLLATGRRRLVFVGGPTTLQPVAERREGFLRAVADADLTSAGDIAPEHVNRADGWKVGRALAPRVVDGEVDGIMAATDLLAAGIIQALSEDPRIDLPGSVGIIGYDNNQAAWDAPIPISTVSQPGRELGAEGVRLLLDDLRSLAADDGHRHRSIGLVPRLVQRESTRR